MMQRITLDIDNKKPKPYNTDITKMLNKIANCPNSQTITCQMSPSTNGYHITVWCNKKCPICRMTYDDQVRHERDTINRKPHQQNILFDTYTIKGNHKPINL